MVGSEIELGPSDSRWLTTNILIHDLCHDFNVSTMKQRMSKLNSLFKRFSDKFPIKNSMLTGGGKDIPLKRKHYLMQERNLMQGLLMHELSKERQRLAKGLRRTRAGHARVRRSRKSPPYQMTITRRQRARPTT